MTVPLAMSLIAGPVPANKPSAYPDWWFERDVVSRLPSAAAKSNPVWPEDYPVADDFSAANLGQLKYVATQAASDLENNLPVALDGTLGALTYGWSQPGTGRDDFAALNQGQLKTVAKPFYDQLAGLGYSLPQVPAGQGYPWTTPTTDDDSYGMANSGQLKHIFSFNTAAVTRQLVLVSGDGQSALSGEPLPEPLKVRVVNRRGDPMAGVAISFQIVFGSGSLGSSVVASNAQGEAAVGLTISGTIGAAVRVKAQIPGDSLEFVANVGGSPLQETGNGDTPPSVTPPVPNPGGDPHPPGLDPSPNPLLPPGSISVAPRERRDSQGNLLPSDPTEVTIKWNYSGPNDISGFIVEMSRSGGNWQVISTPPFNIDHDHKANLSMATRYEFRVRTRRGDFKSIPSQIAAYQAQEDFRFQFITRTASGGKGVFQEFADVPVKYYLTRNSTWDIQDHYPNSIEWSDFAGSEAKAYTPAPDPEHGTLKYEVSAYSYHSSGLTAWFESEVLWNASTRQYDYIENGVTYPNQGYVYDPESATSPGDLTIVSSTEKRWEHPEPWIIPGWSKVVLSNLYETESFMSDVVESLSPYPAWDDVSGVVVTSDMDSQVDVGWELSWGGWFGAMRQLSANEVHYETGRAKYRILRRVAANTLEECKWAEAWVKRDADKLESEEPPFLDRLKIKRTLTWHPGSSLTSTEYEAKGDEAEADGYYVLIGLNPRINVSAPGGYFDPEEKSDGIPVYNIGMGAPTSEVPAGREFTLDNFTMPGGRFQLTWAGSNKFKIYGLFPLESGQTQWQEISSGYTYVPGEEGAPTRFAVVALWTITDGADFKVTLKQLDASSEVVGTDAATFEFVSRESFDSTYPIEIDSGARYRKVALNGAPLPDSPPQAASETDQPAEETFIDALTTGLRHSTTDLYMPVPASDLVLGVRRSAAPLIWNNRHGLRPHERADLPFGPGWNCSLAPTLRIASELDGRTYAYVEDEHGQSFRFLSISGAWLPLPSSRTDTSAYLAKLEGFTFTRKFGSKIFFDGSATLVQNVAADRWTGGAVSFNEEGQIVVRSPERTVTTYYRASRIEDRQGRALVFEYPNGDAFVPHHIYVAGNAALQLRIRQNAQGRVTSIWDPVGFETVYGYTAQTLPDGNSMDVLTSVTAPDGGKVRYTYDTASELDQTPLPEGEIKSTYFHVNLATIKDPLGKTHTFHYDFDHTKSAYKRASYYDGYYLITGLPRLITSVDLPGGGGADFDNQSHLALAITDPLSPALTNDSVRQTVVTDAAGHVRSYTWDLPKVDEMLVPGELPGSRPRVALFLKLSIANAGFSAETYYFAPEAGMALCSATDLSGNTTTHTYTDPWSAPAAYRVVFPSEKGINGFYDDPTSQTNALNKTKSFTYQAGTRIMTSQTDELGNKLEWTVEGGLRKEEKVYKNGTTLVQHTTFAYGSASFPAFVTMKTVKKLTIDGSPDPTWVSDMATEYVPDANGRLWKEIVDPSGLALTTVYTYDANGNKETITDPRGKATRFFYDKRNRVKQVNYADGYNRRFEYDSRGNKVKEFDEKGVATLWSYDALNRVQDQALDMNGNGLIDSRSVDLVTSYTYTALSAQETVTGPKGTVTKLEYDALNRLWHKTEDFGESTPAQPRFNYLTTYEYDLTKNPGGTVFDSTGWKPTKVTDPRGYTVEVVYDKTYHPLQETVQYKAGGHAVTDKTYDDAGRLATITGPATLVDGSSSRLVTQTTYDALGRMTEVTEGAGTSTPAVTTTAYTSTGLAHRVTAPLVPFPGGGQARPVTDTEYDAAGRPVKVFSPEVADGLTGARSRPTAETRYDANGNVSYTIDPLGCRTDHTYDDRNRRTVIQAPSVTDATTSTASRPTLRTVYDPVGNPLAVQNALGLVTDTEFDEARRPRKVTAPAVPLPDGTTARPVTETTYYADGTVHTVKDAKGRITTNTYDALGRLHTTTDAANITVTYDYDAAGNRTDVWDGKIQPDGKGQHTRFDYDGLNRLTATTDAANRAVAFEYDAINKTARVDSENRRTEYKYDARHRLKEVKYIGRSQDDRAYAYDALNRILTVTEPGKGGAADVAYAYDELGRQLTETSSGVTHAYGYDKTGNRTKVVYGGAIATTLVSTYDALNRLETLAETTVGISGTRTTTYGYDLGDRRVRQQLPSGEVVLSRYDALGRTTGATTTQADGTPVLQLTQAYDLVGNAEKIAERHFGPGALAPRTVVNSYDAINRLLTETSTQAGKTTATTYGYDNAHNRGSRIVLATYRGQSTTETTAYTYNNLNQLQTAAIAGGATTTYHYDNNGNRGSRTAEGQTDTYGYDYENRLVSLTKATAGGAGAYAYVYDYRTRRVARTESGSTTKSVFSGGVSVADYVGTTPQARYVRGSDWGGGVGGLLYSLRDGQASYKLYNARGDVVAATDSAAAPTWRASYEAFGKRVSEAGSTQDRQKANTKEEDPTGLLNEGFRYRDLETGTFITRDPLGFVDGPNMYTYVVQNPWSKFDPRGLFMGTNLSVGEWFGAVGSGVAQGAYNVTVGAVVDSYKAGVDHMAGAMTEASEGNIGMAALHGVAAVGEVANLALTAVGAGEAVAAGKNLLTGALRNEAKSLATGAAKAEASEVAAGVAKKAEQVVEEVKDVNQATQMAGCFVAGTWIAYADLTYGAIERVQVGERVATPFAPVLETAPDRADLRLVTLEKRDPSDGSLLFHVDALESIERIKIRQIHEGGELWYEVAEIGFADTMKVTAVRDCPELADGPGRLVTATYIGNSVDVWRIVTDASDETLQATGGHPFYSETRDDWIPASQLEIGEIVRTSSGSTHVRSVSQLPGRFTVYNFTVDVEHCYYVGTESVLVHNAGNPCSGVGTQSAKEAGGAAKRGPKPKGTGPHNELVEKRINDLKDQGYTDVRGGLSGAEETIQTPGGYKESRRVDISAKSPDGSTYREQIGKTKADGTPVTREVKAMDDIEKITGTRPVFTPYD